jgi:hypothetical protein
MKKFYSLTERGYAIARSPYNSESIESKVVHFLDFNGMSTMKVITNGTGAGYSVVATLVTNGIIQEV